jgi:hypothetical protein
LVGLGELDRVVDAPQPERSKAMMITSALDRRIDAHCLMWALAAPDRRSRAHPTDMSVDFRAAAVLPVSVAVVK